MKNNKTRRLYIRLTEQQFEIVRKKSDDANMSMTNFFLDLLGIEKAIYQHKELIDIIYKLVSNDKRVENNINQVAKHLNQNSERISDQVICDYIDMIEKYMNKRDKIKRVLGRLISLMADYRL
ncbi:hypothetical protein [Parabacteroides sp. PF5-9]|uniref:hypothetical protein n=1 Tax=Parabacteroides sp. PF5-9 TaxID=1742404 RepID=UPI00247537FC|nr:hypothetical protein [Parabacteroides sp. PF5-9]MDH6356238.1 isopentenyldiphosphate isomerase [Parabacteroides sp. PF5-9]